VRSAADRAFDPHRVRRRRVGRQRGLNGVGDPGTRVDA
jgi:hypothetical protein